MTDRPTDLLTALRPALARSLPWLSCQRTKAKLLIIAFFAGVAVLGASFGILAASLVLGEEMHVPQRILDRAIRAAMLSVFGMVLALAAVMVHASGAAEDSQVRRPIV